MSESTMPSPPAGLFDEALLARLDALDRPETFAAALGEPLAGRPHSLPLGAAPLGKWLPFAAGFNAGDWRIPLVWAGNRRFSRPFSADDLNVWRQRPLGQWLTPWLSLDDLIDRGEALGAAAPVGLILHISRCGSTLLTRMLGALPGVTAVAEAVPLEAMLGARRKDPGMDETTQIRAIRAMAALLGRPRNGERGGVVFKLDSWSLLDLDLVRLAFPSTPMVILHRDPAAVLASHARRPGQHMIPGLIDWRCDPPAETLTAHGARLLGALCAAGEAAVGKGGRALAYEDLVSMPAGEVAGLFGLKTTKDDLAAMCAVRRLDAKAPDLAFNASNAADAGHADPAMVAEADRWARPAWRRLAALG